MTLLGRPLLTPDARKVCSRTERVFIIENNVALKYYYALYEAFSTEQDDFQHLRTQYVLVRDKFLSRDKATDITALPISGSASGSRTGHGFKNLMLDLVVLCFKRFVY